MKVVSNSGEFMSTPDYIALIRRKPSPDIFPGLEHELRDAIQKHDSSAVFLQGDGVEMLSAIASVASSDARVDWYVCKTSLERRSAADTFRSPFRLATLTAFYASVLSARHVDSWGAGGKSFDTRALASGASEASHRLLLEVGFAPHDQRQHRETLEMALGAAALELDASVLFCGDGRAHLAGGLAHGWSQVTDFGLLDIYVEGPIDRFQPEVAVQRLDTAGAALLRAGAVTILTL